MHISFITSHFPFQDSKSVGGIGTSIKNLSDELVSLGHIVTVFVHEQDTDEKTIDNGINVVKIKNVKVKGLSWFFTRKKIQKVILAVHKKSKIDIIETPDWEGITSFINLPFPVVVRLHGSDTYFCHLDQRKVKWINKFHEKRAIKKANAYLSVSKYTADVTNELLDLNIDYTIIPNGINTTIFKRNESLNLGDRNIFKEKTILYFGGIIRKKGLLEIPHYFNKINQLIPDAQLILIGKDMKDNLTGNISTFSMIEPIFSNLGRLKVKFLGSVPYQEIKKHIEYSTVCIFPSYAEALPVSWLEAMALEKAIVASNIGWADEIIMNNENGFLVDPQNHNLFADTIISLLENELLCSEIGKEARSRVVDKFDISKVVIENVEFYKDIISQNTKQ
ncbi:glycosyltransferase family 4 protein [Flavobacterium bizetiae]|uniref:glycosyltransferase family 4 protein n=1 Tax=Flavobacterium bizetiae TaxID=2704140 RepID=UPI0021E8E543|nr:glycosyltransferase family 4 protein [Flavobacterium bizetiae]UTN04593.1 glycosyltransferase family 4 protein [Flavobacterium bizetiae]